MKVVLILIAILPWTDAFGDDDSCNRIGRKCLTQAHCNPETGQCECPNGTYGDGSFECVANDEYLCRIDSDPKVRTWDGASGDVSLPCWYRVMAVATILVPEFSWLHVNLFARNRMRSDGLFYVSEIRMVMAEYTFQQSSADDNGDFVLESQIKFSLTVDAIWAAGGGNPWSYPPMVSWNGVVLLFTWNPQDNFAVITMANYGCRIKFRAFDPEALPQVMKPGISVMVPPNVVWFTWSDHEPDWLGLCLVPGLGEDVLRIRALDMGVPHRSILVMYYALRQPGLEVVERERSCNVVRQVLGQCKYKPILAINVCGAILNKHSIASCLLKRNYNPMEVFMDCVRWVCEENRRACRRIRWKFVKRPNSCPTTRRLRRVLCRTRALERMDRLLP